MSTTFVVRSRNDDETPTKEAPIWEIFPKGVHEKYDWDCRIPKSVRGSVAQILEDGNDIAISPIALVSTANSQEHVTRLLDESHLHASNIGKEKKLDILQITIAFGGSKRISAADSARFQSSGPNCLNWLHTRLSLRPS